jgi:ATP-dependent Lon protease
VNGLYATTAGVGGITIIESFKTFSDSKLSLLLTGQQGDVMKESMHCAKTVAWNLIPNAIKKKINDDWKKIRFGGSIFIVLKQQFPKMVLQLEVQLLWQ